MFGFRKEIRMPLPSEALPGRSSPLPTAKRHFVNGKPLKGPFPEGLETALFGLGCFWGADRRFWQMPGVTETAVGYMGGHAEAPTYEQVCTGRTGCNEVVRLVFDPALISLREILEIFFVIHDPTTLNRQGNDSGTQYRSGIYYSTPGQKQVAEDMVHELNAQKLFGKPVVTEVLPVANYWPAEEYHQDFFAKNPNQGYCVAVVAPKVNKVRSKFTHLLK